MSAIKFVDTNILLYAYDLSQPAKKLIASEIVETGWSDFGSRALSVQVLQELCANLKKVGLTPAEAREIGRDFSLWPTVSNTRELFLAGLEEQARWNLSLWDAMIIAAARAAGADEILSEDLSHGQDYGGVRVINPFR